MKFVLFLLGFSRYKWGQFVPVSTIPGFFHYKFYWVMCQDVLTRMTVGANPCERRLGLIFLYLMWCSCKPHQFLGSKKETRNNTVFESTEWPGQGENPIVNRDKAVSAKGVADYLLRGNV
jgi:hypothetical protein